MVQKDMYFTNYLTVLVKTDFLDDTLFFFVDIFDDYHFHGFKVNRYVIIRMIKTEAYICKCHIDTYISHKSNCKFSL